MRLERSPGAGLLALNDEGETVSTSNDWLAFRERYLFYPFDPSDRILAIGLGLGGTARWLLSATPIAELVVVERSAFLLELFRFRHPSEAADDRLSLREGEISLEDSSVAAWLERGGLLLDDRLELPLLVSKEDLENDPRILLERERGRLSDDRPPAGLGGGTLMKSA